MAPGPGSPGELAHDRPAGAGRLCRRSGGGIRRGGRRGSEGSDARPVPRHAVPSPAPTGIAPVNACMGHRTAVAMPDRAWPTIVFVTIEPPQRPAGRAAGQPTVALLATRDHLARRRTTTIDHVRLATVIGWSCIDRRWVPDDPGARRTRVPADRHRSATPPWTTRAAGMRTGRWDPRRSHIRPCPSIQSKGQAQDGPSGRCRTAPAARDWHLCSGKRKVADQVDRAVSPVAWLPRSLSPP